MQKETVKNKVKQITDKLDQGVTSIFESGKLAEYINLSTNAYCY